MGNKAGGSASSALKKKDLKDLTDATHFDEAEVVAIYEHFRSIAAAAAAKGGEDSMDRASFLQSLNVKGSVFLDRVFAIIDTDRDGKISFAAYLAGLSVLCARGTLNEKSDFAFRLYDFDADGKISKQELSDMLQWSLEESEVKVTPAQVASIIAETFRQADRNGDGFIDPAEFKALVDKDPGILSSVTLDFKNMMTEAAEKAGA